MTLWVALFALMTPLPVCESGALDVCREILLQEVNAQRLAADLVPVVEHPVLDAVARDRAREIANGGSVDPSMARLQATTTRLYRDGYGPHDWTESSLIGRWGSGVFEQWSEVNPRWYEEVRVGDFEHLGVGVERSGRQPVFTLVFGLSKRSVEWRLASPLADLESVRRELLREVNAQRRERGRDSLRANAILDAAAQKHAEDMLRYSFYSHEDLSGDEVEARVREAGYGRARAVSENIAKGLFSPTEVVQRWMASSGHRRNILSAKVTELGGGVTFGENENGFEVVWVQVFASEPQGRRIDRKIEAKGAD